MTARLPLNAPMNTAFTKADKDRGQRIRHVRKALRLTQTMFAELLNVQRGAVTNWERGGGITPANLALITERTGAPIDWLYAGKGTTPQRFLVQIAANSRDASLSSDSIKTLTIDKPYRGILPNSIPDVLVNIGAGAGGVGEVSASGLVTGNVVRGEIVLPDYLLADMTRSQPGLIHSLRVDGDSMYPTLLSGDRVFVDTTVRTCGQGGVFALYDKILDEVIVKRLSIVANGGEKFVEIRSDNPKDVSRRVLAKDIVVIGRVVGRITKM